MPASSGTDPDHSETRAHTHAHSLFFYNTEGKDTKTHMTHAGFVICFCSLSFFLPLNGASVIYSQLLSDALNPNLYDFSFQIRKYTHEAPSDCFKAPVRMNMS